MVGSFLLDVMLLQFRMPTDLVAKVVRYYAELANSYNLCYIESIKRSLVIGVQ
jgi:hypothetical protein